MNDRKRTVSIAVRAVTTLVAISLGGAAAGQAYRPPAASAALLGQVDWTAALPLNETYRGRFVACDGLAQGGRGSDTFRGHQTPRRCTTDPSRVRTLLKLADGGVLWESKMALDVDGSWAATSGRRWRDARGRVRQTTDQCGTALKWRTVRGSDCADGDAQVDPDLFPYVVIPAGGTGFLPKEDRASAAREFRDSTGLGLRDMGVVIVGDRWSPAFVADTGPVFRLGEASARVFDAIGRSRCRTALAADGRCRGDGSERYPYVDSGIGSGVIFILYPGSGAGLTRENAVARICAFAREKLGLSGSAACPS